MNTDDWASYEAIADQYAEVAEPHYFARPAADLVAMLAPNRGARFLDAGAGSGAVARCALVAVGPTGIVLALDPAIPMLLRCPKVTRAAAAALPRVPLRDEQFDCASAAFVMTHLAEPQTAVASIARTLRLGGRIGLSSWCGSPASSAPGELWQQVVARFSNDERLGDAVSRALPSEARFAALERLAALFDGETFDHIHAETRRYDLAMPTDAYATSRLLAIPSRYLKSQLPSDEWERFTREARGALRERFGTTLSFSVTVNFALATRVG